MIKVLEISHNLQQGEKKVQPTRFAIIESFWVSKPLQEW
jgi:hypothetical protein